MASVSCAGGLRIMGPWFKSLQLKVSFVTFLWTKNQSAWSEHTLSHTGGHFASPKEMVLCAEFFTGTCGSYTGAESTHRCIQLKSESKNPTKLILHFLVESERIKLQLCGFLGRFKNLNHLLKRSWRNGKVKSCFKRMFQQWSKQGRVFLLLFSQAAHGGLLHYWLQSCQRHT